MLGVLVAALAGLIMGQALDLLWERFYSGEEVRTPLYRCAECKAPLRPVYAVPFAAGILWEKGVCPDCGEPLPLRSIILPAGATILFIISYAAFGQSLGPGLLGGFFATVFLTLTLTDLESHLLPNRIVYPSIVIAAVLCWAWPDTSAVQILAGGFVAILIAAGMLAFSQLFGPEAFGLGDVKMIVLMGFVAGVPSIIVGVFVGTIAGGVAAGLLILTRRRSRRDYIPHGPFLALGAIIALFWGNAIWDAYTGG